MNKVQKKLESWKVEREVDEYNESYAFREGYAKAMCDAINLVKNLTIPVVSVSFSAKDMENFAANMLIQHNTGNKKKTWEHLKEWVANYR